jgi:hypothetical protein
MKLAKPVLAKVDAGFAAYSCDRPGEERVEQPAPPFQG